MLYADRVGFRAGTARPFTWYNLSTESITSLKVIPYTAMDVTMRYYMDLAPTEAITAVKELQGEAKHVQGYFGFLWHNSSMSEAFGWEPWLPVLHECLSQD